jgi:hypothetical protein
VRVESRARAADASGLRAETVRPAVIFAAHAILFLVLLNWSWRKWPDPIIDFGRELYIPWQITRGQVLYRDIASLFGPLSPYVNALWFRLFGVSLTTIAVCNVVIFAAVLAGIYRFVRACADRVTATAATLLTMLVFGFSQYVDVGNYNFVCPYSHEATHGLAISIALLLCLARAMATRGRVSWAAGGLCFGLVTLTKPEMAVAALAATTAAILGSALLDRHERPRLGLNVALFSLAAMLPPLGFFLFFLGHMGLAPALRATAGAWVQAAGTGIAASPFYLRVTGLDQPIANLTRMLLTFAGFAIFVGAAMVVSRARSATPPSTIQRVQQAALLLAASAFSVVATVFYALPLIVLSTLVVSVLLLRGARGDRDRSLRFLWIVVWSAFALVLLAKMGLNARIVHYGFYLALPATVATIVLIVWLIPQAIDGWSGGGSTFRVIALCAFVAGLAPYLWIAHGRYQSKTVPIGSGGDLFFASSDPRAWQGVAVRDVLAQLRSAPGATLAVLPEGVMLNYLSRRRSPLRVVNLMPPELMAFGQADILRSLEAAPPDTVLLMHRDVAEYGVPPFGESAAYGGPILSWVRAHYQVIGVIGDDPSNRRGFGIVVFGRRTS